MLIYSINSLVKHKQFKILQFSKAYMQSGKSINGIWSKTLYVEQIKYNALYFWEATDGAMVEYVVSFLGDLFLRITHSCMFQFFHK